MMGKDLYSRLQKKMILLSFLSFLFPGCLRVGPDFKAPETVTQDAWTEKSDRIMLCEELEVGSWWKQYQDETLNCLISFALENNQNLEAAAERILAARAQLGFAIGECFPQTQQAEGSSFKAHLSANASNTLNASRNFIDGVLGFRAAWELDFWGRYYRGVQSAWGDYAASQDDYRDVERILISDIVLAFVQQKTLQNRIIALEKNIAIQYRSAEVCKVRWENGYESELDYAQAVTLWKETVAQKVNKEIELKNLTTSLAILAGLTPEQFDDYFSISPDPLAPPVNISIGYPVQILFQRPDLRRSLDLLYAQCARVGIAVSDLYPRISITGFLGIECASGTHSTFNQKGKRFFSRNSLTFLYGPDFVWPLLNYGRLENKIKEQYAILNEGIALYRNQVLEAFKEVEDALTFFVKSVEETENVEAGFLSAKRAVEIATIQYNEGLADYTRVLNSLQLQVVAEDRLVQTQGNIGLAYAFIYKALY